MKCLYFAQWNNKTRKIFCMALTLQWWQIRRWQLYALFHMCINKTANRLSRKQVNEWRKKSDHFNRFQIALTLEACEHHKKVFPDENSYKIIFHKYMIFWPEASWWADKVLHATINALIYCSLLFLLSKVPGSGSRAHWQGEKETFPFIIRHSLKTNMSDANVSIS